MTRRWVFKFRFRRGTTWTHWGREVQWTDDDADAFAQLAGRIQTQIVNLLVGPVDEITDVALDKVSP
jgi:hypothetical protein